MKFYQKSTYTIIYTLKNDGSLEIFSRFYPKTIIPRFGIIFSANLEDFEKINYYGLGPHENYVDRQSSAIMGIHELKDADMENPYTYPQEYGRRGGCTWIRIMDNGKCRLKIFSNEPFGFNAWPYNQQLINKTKHVNELKPKGFLTMNIESRQMGVGGYDSWSERAHPIDQHLIKPEMQELRFSLRPF